MIYIANLLKKPVSVSNLLKKPVSVAVRLYTIIRIYQTDIRKNR